MHHSRACAVLTALLAVSVLVACQRPPELRPPTIPLVVYDNPGWGISFALPADWTAHVEGDAAVFSGALGTAAYFTTLTVQASPLAPSGSTESLDRVLDATYASLETDHPPRFLERVPVRLPGGTAAVRYVVAFELHERERLRSGLLMALPRSVVDFNYTAPLDLFAESFAVFEQAVDSLATGAEDGGWP